MFFILEEEEEEEKRRDWTDFLLQVSKQASKQERKKGRKKVNCSSYHGDSIKCEQIYKEYID